MAAGTGGAVFWGGVFERAAQTGPFSLASTNAISGFAAALQDNVGTAARAGFPAAAYAIYPNPTAGSALTFALPAPPAPRPVVVIEDATGRRVRAVTVRAAAAPGPALALEFAPLPPGFYFVHYVNESVRKPFAVQ